MEFLRTSRRVRASQRAIFLGGCGLIVTASVALTAPNAAIVADGGQHSVVPGGLYTGSRSCEDDNCHSGKPKKQSGQMIGDEYTIWKKRDPHRKGYEKLSNDDSKAIAAKMGFGDPAAEASCQKCHAPNVPADQFKAGDAWPIDEGVGCEVCHGPADLWIKPHEEAGWTGGERKAKRTAGLFAEYKLIDTSDLRRRAELCVSCHLNIDSGMVAAGHPPLEFEMGAYDNYLWIPYKGKPRIHWKPADDAKMLDAKLWGVGQEVGLEAARAQAAAWKADGADTNSVEGLVRVYEGGLAIARKHGVLPLDAATSVAQTEAAAADLAGLAAEATSAAELSIILNGVIALKGAPVGGPSGVKGLVKRAKQVQASIKTLGSSDAAADEQREKIRERIAKIAALELPED